MRTIVIIGFAVGLLSAALPAQATDTNAAANRSDATAREQAPAGQSANNGDRERQICVRDTRSETRIPRTICHTAREWRDLGGLDSNDG
jgi:hypothetical protein